MQIFINELSLEGQYFSQEEFTKAIKVFIELFDVINEKHITQQTYKTGDKATLFYPREAIRNEVFLSSFQKLSNHGLKKDFVNIVFNKLNSKDWQIERQHSPDDIFTWQDDIVTETSLAELAERKIQNDKLLGLLINFTRSKFATYNSITITKNEEITTALDCLDSKEVLERWLETNLQLSFTEYDLTSMEPPTDKQTILRDRIRFESSSLTPQGRKAYREIATGYYWYVDNLHYGKNAQLEVFNAQGQHLGIATLDGQLDRTKIKHGRTINVH